MDLTLEVAFVMKGTCLGGEVNVVHSSRSNFEHAMREVSHVRLAVQLPVIVRPIAKTAFNTLHSVLCTFKT